MHRVYVFSNPEWDPKTLNFDADLSRVRSRDNQLLDADDPKLGPFVSRGGNGASTFDVVAALDAWKTGGTPPASIPASRVRNGTTDRTRPLCAYPKFAAYKGSGSIDDAANFECRQ